MGQLEVHVDEIAERLDELADLGEVWSRHRKAGREPSATRAAMIMITNEVQLIIQIQENNLLGKRPEPPAPRTPNSSSDN